MEFLEFVSCQLGIENLYDPFIVNKRQVDPIPEVKLEFLIKAEMF